MRRLHSLVDLDAAINRFVAEYNKTDPKPFIWKADPDLIIAAVRRGHQTLVSIHYVGYAVLLSVLIQPIGRGPTIEIRGL